MPLEYFSNLQACQIGSLGNWAQQSMQTQIQQATQEIDPDLKGKIRKLPLKTQMQILTEIRYSPGMIPRITALLQAKDPFKAIVMDQMLTIGEVYQPGYSPEHANLWPMLRKYTSAALQVGVVKADKVPMSAVSINKGISGFDPKPAWKTARQGRLSYSDMLPMSLEGLGDSFSDAFKQLESFWKSDGIKLYDQYGKPLLQNTISQVTGTEIKDVDIDKANAAANAELNAKMEQMRKQAETSESKDEEKKSSWPTWLGTVLVLSGVALAAAPTIFFAVKK